MKKKLQDLSFSIVIYCSLLCLANKSVLYNLNFKSKYLPIFSLLSLLFLSLHPPSLSLFLTLSVFLCPNILLCLLMVSVCFLVFTDYLSVTVSLSFSLFLLFPPIGLLHFLSLKTAFITERGWISNSIPRLVAKQNNKL